MNWKKKNIVKIFPKLMQNFSIECLFYMYVVNSCFVHSILIKPLSHYTAVKEVTSPCNHFTYLNTVKAGASAVSCITL